MTVSCTIIIWQPCPSLHLLHGFLFLSIFSLCSNTDVGGQGFSWLLVFITFPLSTGLFPWSSSVCAVPPSLFAHVPHVPHVPIGPHIFPFKTYLLLIMLCFVFPFKWAFQWFPPRALLKFKLYKCDLISVLFFVNQHFLPIIGTFFSEAVLIFIWTLRCSLSFSKLAASHL